MEGEGLGDFSDGGGKAWEISLMEGEGLVLHVNDINVDRRGVSCISCICSPS